MIKRRKFIKTTGALSLSTMLPWSSVFSATNSTQNSSSANDKIIVAVIGAGGRGTKLIKMMTEIEGVETKYVCEVDDTRGYQAMRDLETMQGYTPKRVEDMRKIFDDKDVDAGLIIHLTEAIDFNHACVFKITYN